MKGILFTPPMAVAACVGRKTQTRRVIVPQPHPSNGLMNAAYCGHPEFWLPTGSFSPSNPSREYRPDYQPGERRCLLTTWAVQKCFDSRKPSEVPWSVGPVFWHAGMGTPKPDWAGKLRPGRFLPNHLRPLMPVFEIVIVRAERVQDISEQDAEAEGVERNQGHDPWTREDGWIKYPLDKNLEDFPAFTAKESFQTLWDSINATPGPVAGVNGAVRYVSYPWDGKPETKTHRGQPWTVVPNPWVWVVEFRGIKP